MSNAENTPMAMDDLSADPATEVAQASDTTEQADVQPETPVTPASLTKLKNTLRAEAEREVLANHRDEYHAVASRKFAEKGLEFTRRLTDEERAEKQLQELLAANPALAAKYNAAQ